MQAFIEGAKCVAGDAPAAGIKNLGWNVRSRLADIHMLARDNSSAVTRFCETAVNTLDTLLDEDNASQRNAPQRVNGQISPTP